MLLTGLLGLTCPATRNGLSPPMSIGNQENVPTLAKSQSDGGKSLLKVPSSQVCQVDSQGDSKNSKDVSQVTEELTTCPCLLVYSS